MNDKKKMKDIICKNCTSLGHIYRDCPHPVCSFGIICYMMIDNIPYYIMIQRKNSLSFMEFIKGNYNVMDLSSIKSLCSTMTKDEHFILLNYTFDVIWEMIWFQSNNKNTKEYTDASTNFEILTKNGYLKNILKGKIQSLNEPEWGFPKGRKKQNESDIECALREFNEETQFTSDQIKIKNILNPYNEIFYGTNGLMYRHTYYVAEFIDNGSNSPKFNMECLQQIREIRNICWLNRMEVLNHISYYNKERIELFKRIDDSIHK